MQHYCFPPTLQKNSGEICQDVNSDYQWYKVYVNLVLFLLLGIFQFPTRQSEILSTGIKKKKKKEISFLLQSQLTAPRVAAQVFTTVVWRPERACHVHGQLGGLWAALSMVRQACPAWYGRCAVIQVSHHRRVSSLWYCYALHLSCLASEPYLPRPLFLHCPVNVRGTDWDRLTPSEDAVGQQSKADASLPLNSKSAAQAFLPRWRECSFPLQVQRSLL